MLHCGLLSKPTIRQVQSDIVDVVALGRLRASDIESAQSQPPHLEVNSEPRFGRK